MAKEKCRTRKKIGMGWGGKKLNDGKYTIKSDNYENQIATCCASQDQNI